LNSRHVHCTHYAPFNRQAYTKLATANFKKINQTTEDILDDLKSLFNALHKAYKVPPNSLLKAALLRTLQRHLRSINHIHSQRCPLCKAPAPADDSLIHTTDFERMTSVITDQTNKTISVLPPKGWEPGLALANHYDPKPCPIRTPRIG
jgi:hypothetical protein